MDKRLYPDTNNPKHNLECTDANTGKHRFDITKMDAAIEYLLQNGYVVIKNVLNKSELDYGKSLLWKYLQSFGWDKDNYKTWNPWDIGGEVKNGILWERSGQSDFQWYGRKHPKVLQIFSKLWSHKLFENKPIDPKKDLLTSFDGCSVFYPWYLNKLHKTNAGWYHIDQNTKKKRGIHTIQGYISYFDQNESTGSTVFIPTTNNLVQKYLKISKYLQSDFVMIPQKHKLINDYKKILLCCKAGDFLLWDSRTIHCSSPALLSLNEMKDIHLYKKKSINSYYNNNSNASNNGKLILNKIDELLQIFDDDQKNDCLSSVDILRATSYICMVPKSRLKYKKSIIKSRVAAYIENKTTSHWPTECSILFYPRNIPQKNIDDADDLTKSLIGLDPSSNTDNDGL